MYESAAILAGLIVGYLVVSLCESLFHRIFGHSSARLRRFCRRHARLGTYVLRAWYAHYVIHHKTTFRRDHVTQFASADEEARLRERLLARGQGHIPAQDYGLRVGDPGEFLRFVAPTLPVLALVCWLGGPWFSLGALLPLIAMPLMSELIHPLLHLTSERAREAAPALLKPFVATRVFRYIARHHWLHHRHPEANFNLMPGGDLILRCYRTPSGAELEEMAAIGLR